MKKLHGEESNWIVLKRVLANLKKGTDRQEIIDTIEPFVKAKLKQAAKIDKINQKARSGDKEAAKEFIRELSKMNDGP